MDKAGIDYFTSKLTDIELVTSYKALYGRRVKPVEEVTVQGWLFDAIVARLGEEYADLVLEELEAKWAA